MWGNPLVLGRTLRRKKVLLSADDRKTHLYVCGTSNCGKSKFLEHLIRQDIQNHLDSRCGLLLIDWHGTLYDDLMYWLASVDPYRRLPLVPIDLRRDELIMSYHLLRHRDGAYDSVVVGNLIQDLAYAWGQSDLTSTPRFARIARDVLQVLYEHKLTLSDASILISPEHSQLRRVLTQRVSDAEVLASWASLNQMKPEKREELFESTINRLRTFVSNRMMRCMFGQEGRSFDWSEAVEEGHIVLLSLAKGKGKATVEDCKTFATVLLSDLWSAAQERDKRSSPKPFYVYLDEFQHFVTPTIAENLDEARGFGLHMTMAHQFPTQLLDNGEAGRKVYNSVMANATNKVVFRTNHLNDLDTLANYLFMGILDPEKVKHVLHSTKVLDYEEIDRTVTTRSRGHAEGDVVLKMPSGLESTDERGSTSEVDSELEATQDQVVMRPVLGEEISSIQYVPLEEQLHAARARINTLKSRNCIARLAETAIPVAFRTVDVEEEVPSDAYVQSYARRQLKKWKFVLPFAQAEANVDQRPKKLEQQYLQLGNDDDAGPTVFRRRIES